MDHPVSVRSYTVPQAAEAIGKSLATVRRWISDDKIPAPYLRDSSRGFLVYSVGELELMLRILRENETQFVYFSEHAHVRETLHQAIHGYRALYI